MTFPSKARGPKLSSFAVKKILRPYLTDTHSNVQSRLTEVQPGGVLGIRRELTGQSYTLGSISFGR
ncbi:hypothetical protein D9M68_903690 [compost metagenome]